MKGYREHASLGQMTPQNLVAFSEEAVPANGVEISGDNDL